MYNVIVTLLSLKTITLKPRWDLILLSSLFVIVRTGPLINELHRSNGETNLINIHRTLTKFRWNSSGI